jgi:ketosteroid isomerase-like protein
MINHLRRLLLAAFLGVAAGVSGNAAAADAVDKAVVDQLTRQADAWDKAIVRKDREAIAGNMADDFRQIDAAGGIEDKASFLEDVLSPKLRIDPYTVEDFEVRVYGDVALLSGRTRMTGAYDGKAFNTHYRYIDVYVRKNGVWRVASVQITRVRD